MSEFKMVQNSKRKIKSPDHMEELWERYKKHCNNQSVLLHEFSQRNSEFVTAEVKKRVTYTIEGFCHYIKLTRGCFYATYCEDENFKDIVDLIREECEVDARTKFETGDIPHQLAALWMSKYGYTTKTDTRIDGSIPVVIENDLK